MITVLACNPTFGAAYNLRKAFSLWEPTRLITLDTHPLWAGEEDVILTADTVMDCRDMIEDSRFTMIADAAGLNEALFLLGGLDWAKKQRWVAFWGDTAYWQNAEMYNALAEEIGVKTTFAMMDIMSVAPDWAIPLCHPVEDVGWLSEKETSLKIMHSPRTANKRKLKGSDKIEAVMVRLWQEFPKFYFSSLMNLPWRECLELKKEARIFVDQIPDPGMAAGLGRSGEEALAFGSIVLTALHGEEYLKPYFPPPPVIRVYDEEGLYNELRALCLMDRDEIEERGRESRAWAEKYLLFEGWLEYVGRWFK
jgi:hypothetical protein